MKKPKIKKRIYYFSKFLTPAFIVFLFITLYRSYQNIKTSQYYERTTHLNILMSKMAQSVDGRIESTLDKLNFIASRMQIRYSKELTEPLITLKDYETSLISPTGLALFLVDSDGIAYNTNGDISYYLNDFIKENYDLDIYVTPEPVFDNENSLKEHGAELFHFMKKFDFPIPSNGKFFTHIGLIAPVTILSEQLSIPAYKDDSFIYILDSQDRIFYSNEKTFHNYQNSNIFYRLKAAQFNYDHSYEKFLESLNNRENSSLSFSFNKLKFYLSHTYLESEGWTIILVLPEQVVGINTIFLTKRIILDIVTLFILGAFVIVFIILQYFWRENQRNTRVQEQLQKLAEAEHAANKAKTNFLSSMSHDIRTPMNAIVGMTDIALQKSSDSNYMVACLKKIKQSSNHLLMLINDILDISKIESGNMFLNQVPFSIADIIEKINNIAKPLIKEKGIDFDICTKNIKTQFFIGDELRLSQIYINLLTNAIKYTEYGGSVCVDIEQKPSTNPDHSILTYCIKDTGIGISEKFQLQMFDNFSRATDSRVNKIQGSGLGLAICKRFVNLMNGTINCESQLGIGTTFTVTVELQNYYKVEEKNDNTINNEIPTDLSKMKLLVAEDNDMNWEIIETMLALKKIGTCRVENGKQCIDLLNASNENDFSLILMDIRMPVMDGITATQEIRSSNVDWIKKIPIIAMTADAFTEDIQSCLDAGMNDHMAKPVDIDLLLKKITNIHGGGYNKLQKILSS